MKEVCSMFRKRLKSSRDDVWWIYLRCIIYSRLQLSRTSWARSIVAERRIPVWKCRSRRLYVRRYRRFLIPPRRICLPSISQWCEVERIGEDRTPAAGLNKRWNLISCLRPAIESRDPGEGRQLAGARATRWVGGKKEKRRKKDRVDDSSSLFGYREISRVPV